MKLDCVKDVFVISLITVGWAASTVFLFKHPDAMNFATWAGFSGSVICAYKWIDFKDSKVPDADHN